ncbi:hypothetical protein JCM3774_000640 [Rhodotorula dairenensis]
MDEPSSLDEPLLHSSSPRASSLLRRAIVDSAPPPSSEAPYYSRILRSRRQRRAAVATAAAVAGLLALALFTLRSADRFDRWTLAAAGLLNYRGAGGNTEKDPSGRFRPRPPRRREWSAEDRRLRNYTWETPAVHESLERMLADLTPAQNRTRSWLLESRRQTMGGTGIGLGAADPPERIRPAPPRAGHPDATPDEASGPGLFQTGSLSKYSDLVEEWRTGRPVDACEARDWEDAYTELHAAMLSQMRTPSLLEYRCRLGEYCGGLADRILGMTTMFLYSVVTNRAFAVTWEQPAPADLLFDSPHIDWSRPFNQSSTTLPNSPIYSDERLLSNRTEINAHNWDPDQLDQLMATFGDRFGDRRNSSWLQVDFNRGIVMRSFAYPKIKPHLDRLGLRITTAYSCLIQYLFRPKPAVLEFVSRYASFFALPEVFVLGIQIRTGDLSMYAAHEDVINTVERHSQYFTCAEAVARTYADPSQRVVYYLITDSRVLERDALDRFGDRVVVTGLEQAHPEIKTDQRTGLEALRHAADGFMRTIAQSWIFASTDFQIITQRSGFGKIPTWLRGRENTTIALFNPQTDPDWTYDYRKAHNGSLPAPIDCSKREAIKSFHDMAQEWSLG